MKNDGKILGIIVEYNPFHSGHLYQIEKAKQLSGADYVIVVMSGHFVQRGEPAIYDPYIRARMALNTMVDAVFEIPAPFSTASATDFAGFAINLLDKLGVDFISFGTESADIEDLSLISDIIKTNSHIYSHTLLNSISSGINYPIARKNAILTDMKASNYSDERIQRIEEILLQSNNILGIEYIFHLNAIGSKIKPVIIRRKGANYNDRLLNLKSFSSATAIRNSIFTENDIDKISSYIPNENIDLIKQSKPIHSDYYCSELYRKIIALSFQNKALHEYYDISEDMAKRIENNIEHTQEFDALINTIKAKNYTYTRISRAFIHILLDIKKNNVAEYKNKNFSVYAKILGFKKDSSRVLSLLKQKSGIPLISKLADAKIILGESSTEYRLLTEEIYAGLVYNSFYTQIYKDKLPSPFKRHIIIT